MITFSFSFTHNSKLTKLMLIEKPILELVKCTNNNYISLIIGYAWNKIHNHRNRFFQQCNFCPWIQCLLLWHKFWTPVTLIFHNVDGTSSRSHIGHSIYLLFGNFVFMCQKARRMWPLYMASFSFPPGWHYIPITVSLSWNV